MKKRNAKKIIITSVIAVLFFIISYQVLFGTSSVTVTPLKAKYVSVIEDNGVIAEVKFSGPFKYNVVELISESESIYDKNGDITQVITIYDTVLKKSFIYTNEPTVYIEVSDTIDYIYQFNLDETIIIKNGVLVD